MKVPARTLRTARASLLAACTGLAAVACRGGDGSYPASASAPSTSMPSAAVSDIPVDPETQKLLQQLDHSPNRMVRAIATLKAGDPARAQALGALKAAGVGNVQELEGRPLLVIEVNAAQLRALLGTGQVLRVQPDTAAPTN